MSFFNTILEKIGLSKPAAPATSVAPAAKPAAPVAAAPKPIPTADLGPANVASKVGEFVKATPTSPVSEVDVVKKLEQMASGSGLNWQTSIVDMLKVLGIDSSLDARKALATELGCPDDQMHDSAKMNVWLHKAVLKKIAENGGNIPQSLLD
jgi:hypothetical protein